MNNMRILFGLALFLFLLVFILAEIHNAADRRPCRRSDFNQIKPVLFGELLGFEDRDNAYLFRFRTNNADFGDTDLLVNANSLLNNNTSGKN